MFAVPVSCLKNEAFMYVCTFTVVNNEMCQICEHCMS